MKVFFLIGLGGASGSILRYLVYLIFTRHFGFVYPFQTLFVNIIGCLIMGLLIEFFNSKININDDFRHFLLIGFLGGFTTFSAFSSDFFNFMQAGNVIDAFIYIFTSVFSSIFAFFLGIYIIKAIIV
ncbi:MAG: putative fluoride ion transporter CrcB [Alphaproteobacteria bacterium MarineAlpha2_Bin1]|nr:MAG: putative fluoride ion transporter CrcB [Alphaproteobacteria bacterium MarineAlpha2_Bin1]